MYCVNICKYVHPVRHSMMLPPDLPRAEIPHTRVRRLGDLNVTDYIQEVVTPGDKMQRHCRQWTSMGWIFLKNDMCQGPGRAPLKDNVQLFRLRRYTPHCCNQMNNCANKCLRTCGELKLRLLLLQLATWGNMRHHRRH